MLCKKPRKCHFWRFFGLNWPTKLISRKQIFQRFLKFPENFLFQNLMLCKILDSKYERVVRNLIQNLILFEVFEWKFFFSKTCLSESNFPRQHKFANCVVFTLWDDPKELILKRIYQWILIFYKLFCFKPWCIAKVLIQINSDGCKEGCFKIWPVLDFWFSIWPDVKKWLEVRHVLIVLNQNLMHCKSSGLKSDFC